jgi:hypothetical protein
MGKKYLFLVIVLFILMFLDGCKKKNVDGCKYIQTSFYQQLNLNDITYSNLKFDNNYVYYNNAGIKGLIIYRISSTEYRAFERASPLAPNNDHAKIYIDSGVLMRDSVHNQAWDLEGLPYVGPSTCQVYRYSAVVNGAYLILSSN